jgi:hypothetical protein
MLLTDQIVRFAMNIELKGFVPSPKRAIIMPPTMKPS